MAIATVTVDSASDEWIDTGLVLGPGATLYCCASGSWLQGELSQDPDHVFPEGGYADPSNPNPAYNPGVCVTTFGSFPYGFACKNCRPFSLVLAVRPEGSGPPNGELQVFPADGGDQDGHGGEGEDEDWEGELPEEPDPIPDGLQANRSNMFPGVGPGRVWAIVNDHFEVYHDNHGALSLKVGDEPVSCGGGMAKRGLVNDVIFSGLVTS